MNRIVFRFFSKIVEAVAEVTSICKIILSYDDRSDLYDLKMSYSATMEKVKEHCDRNSDLLARKRAQDQDPETSEYV